MGNAPGVSPYGQAVPDVIPRRSIGGSIRCSAVRAAHCPKLAGPVVFHCSPIDGNPFDLHHGPASIVSAAACQFLAQFPNLLGHGEGVMV